MSNLLKSLKIFWQIQIVSAVAMIGFVAIMTTYLVIDGGRADAQLSANRATDVELLAQGIRYEFLNSRRREKDFLLRLQDKYIADHAKVVEAVRMKLTELRQHETSGLDPNEIAQVESGFTGYVEAFGTVAKQWQEIGLTDELGLRGTLRASVHAVEERLKALDQQPLLTAMLTLRRQEKDFLLRLD